MIIPFPTTIVPNWRLRVIDVEGRFCSNKEVSEDWAHYSIYIGLGNHQSEYRSTNEDGFVEFPERTVWAPLIWRIVGSMIANVLTLAHGSAGAHASVYTSGLKDVAWISYKPDKPLPDKMVVHQCSNL